MICENCAANEKRKNPTEEHGIPADPGTPPDSASTTEAFTKPMIQDDLDSATQEQTQPNVTIPVPVDSSTCSLCGREILDPAIASRPPRRRLFPNDQNSPVSPGDPRQDLAIHFDIDKLNASLYGEAAWRIFWTIIDIRDLPPFASLYEGDTDWTLEQNGVDNTYCIRVSCNESPVLAAIRDAFWDSVEYQAVKPLWPFQMDDNAQSQPLVEAGFVSYDHELKGACFNSKPALQSVDAIPLNLPLLFHEAMTAYRTSQPKYVPDSGSMPVFDQPRLQAAHEMFCDYLEAAPNDVEALLMRAQCNLDLGDLPIEEGIHDVETVLESNSIEARPMICHRPVRPGFTSNRCR